MQEVKREQLKILWYNELCIMIQNVATNKNIHKTNLGRKI